MQVGSRAFLGFVANYIIHHRLGERGGTGGAGGGMVAHIGIVWLGMIQHVAAVTHIGMVQWLLYCPPYEGEPKDWRRPGFPHQMERGIPPADSETTTSTITNTKNITNTENITRRWQN